MLGMSKGAHSFKGFGDWVEVFRSGTHTDAAGQVKTWSDADLDQIVANHSAANPAPLVIGHPDTDAPAYGWSSVLKRAGNTLLAKFEKVHDAVDKAAQAGSYRNRSIKVAKTDAGWKLVHVGLLGAAAPAIEGLAPVYAADKAGETYEFGMSDGYWMSQIARGMRRMREFFIAEFGLEKADRVTPAFDIEDLERKATELLNEPAPETDPAPAFNAPTHTPEISVDKKFTQADLDAAVNTAVAGETAKRTELEAKAKASEFAARLATNQAFVKTLIGDDKGEVRLTPAEANGWAEALTHAQSMDDAAAEFTFSAADGTAGKQSLYTFLKAKLEARTPVMKLGQQQVQGQGGTASTDPAVIAQRASEYMAAEAAKGHTVRIDEAVAHVSKAA